MKRALQIFFLIPLLEWRFLVVAGTPPIIHENNIQTFREVLPKGETIVFLLHASSLVGDRPLRYQWSFNGQPIANATGQSYKIVNADFKHAGLYGVEVSNDFGTASYTNLKALVFSIEPDIRAPRRNSSYFLESDLAINVKMAAPEGVSCRYQWLKDGIDIPGATNSSLRLPRLSAVDTGKYNVRFRANFPNNGVSGHAYLYDTGIDTGIQINVLPRTRATERVNLTLDYSRRMLKIEAPSWTTLQFKSSTDLIHWSNRWQLDCSEESSAEFHVSFSDPPTEFFTAEIID